MAKRTSIIFLLVVFVLGVHSLSLAKGPETNTIIINGSINESVVREVIDKLQKMDRDLPLAQDIMVIIRSTGGNLSGAIDICEVMQGLEHDVATIAVDYAQSAAALILSCGTKGKRYIEENAEIMIHDPWMIIFLFGKFKCSDLRKIFEIIFREEEQMYKLLSQNTGKSIEKIREDCQEGKQFKGEEAIVYGLADKIMEPDELNHF